MHSRCQQQMPRQIQLQGLVLPAQSLQQQHLVPQSLLSRRRRRRRSNSSNCSSSSSGGGGRGGGSTSTGISSSLLDSELHWNKLRVSLEWSKPADRRSRQYTRALDTRFESLAVWNRLFQTHRVVVMCACVVMDKHNVWWSPRWRLWCCKGGSSVQCRCCCIGWIVVVVLAGVALLLACRVLGGWQHAMRGTCQANS